MSVGESRTDAAFDAVLSDLALPSWMKRKTFYESQSDPLFFDGAW